MRGGGVIANFTIDFAKNFDEWRKYFPFFAFDFQKNFDDG
jgi:hypothetical protein